MHDNFRQRWIALWSRIGARGDGLAPFENLMQRYSEPHRAYHTLTHIDHCLIELLMARHCAEDPDAVEFALWYHDAVYNPRAKDNEDQSTELAVLVLCQAGATEEFSQKVAALIRATKHTEVSPDADTQLLIDIDLAILGQPEPVFDEYEHNVRKEYEWVPDVAFVEGRSRILKSFLERPQIYSTPTFWCQYEIQARRNLIRSLKRLAEG